MKKIIPVSFACASLVGASLLLQACSGADNSARRADSRTRPAATPTTAPASQQSSDANARPATELPPAEAAHAQPAGPVAAAADGHSHGTPSARVPAYAKTAAEWKSLPPTLAPEQFVGKTRAAYLAVKEIPQTIAQLPCYCYCDEGHGHKSLQTCFVDDHASHCAVCVEEALLAHALHKEGRLSPAQIRERIVEKYSRPQ
jgi:hypothetical protein